MFLYHKPMDTHNCVYLHKGCSIYAVHEVLKIEKLYQIDAQDLKFPDKIKVFTKPNFKSPIYTKILSKEHELWKSNLLKSCWFINNKDFYANELKELDNTFGMIYDILDANNNIVFKFSAGNMWSSNEQKDIDHHINNVLWIKITPDQETWLPYKNC